MIVHDDIVLASKLIKKWKKQGYGWKLKPMKEINDGWISYGWKLVRGNRITK